MMSSDAYLTYLEAIVVSLMKQREYPNFNIPIDDKNSMLHGLDVKPVALDNEIREQRQARIERYRKPHTLSFELHKDHPFIQHISNNYPNGCVITLRHKE